MSRTCPELSFIGAPRRMSWECPARALDAGPIGAAQSAAAGTGCSCALKRPPIEGSSRPGLNETEPLPAPPSVEWGSAAPRAARPASSSSVFSARRILVSTLGYAIAACMHSINSTCN
eukprot:6206878-Pleurochrysis_carterae.AAC.2